MLKEGTTLDAWKKAADDALYAAKAAGRNRLTAA
jgi:PleD family two-component response regulator